MVLLPFALGALAVLGSVASVGWWHGSQLDDIEAENNAMEAELAPLRQLAGVDSLKDAAATLEQRQAVLANLTGSRGDGSALLAAVSGTVRANSWLTTLSWDGQAVRLQGRTFDPGAAADIMDGLRSTGCFDEVRLLAVDTPPGSKERRFSITATDNPAPCGATQAPLGRPFTPSHALDQTPDINRPRLLRWAVALYRVVALIPNKEATLLDPDGRRHTLSLGSMLGRPAAKVTFITDSAVLLSQDEMVNEATDTVQSRILELPLDPETQEPEER